MRKLIQKGKNCYLLGDYNINLINSNESDIANNFADIIYSSFLKPLITKPTGVTSNTATLIDNILTNDFVNYPACVNGLFCADISDHIPIFHVHIINNINSGSKTKRNRNLTRVYNNSSMEMFKNKLKYMDWSIHKDDSDPNIYYDNLLKEFTVLHNQCFPLQKGKYNSYNLKPWATKALLKSIKRKTVLYINFIKSPTTQNKKRFNTYRNKLTSLLRISKRWYINNKLEACKNNMKETWRLLNGLLN